MRKLLTAVSFCLLAVFGCGAPETAEEATEAVDHGAGTVLRVDPVLDGIVPPDYEIEKLADGFQFTEGPVWVDQDGGYLLFSDIPANAIYKWTPNGQVTEFLKPVFEGEYEEGRFVGSNGLLLDSEGRLVLCEHGGRRISRMPLDGGSRTTLADSYEGKKLNSPNDAVFKSDGSLYFTDPPYGFPQQDEDPAKELDFNGIFRLSPDGDLQLLNRDQTRPNGIAFSPDEQTLYVANSDPERKVWMAYGVNDDGTLGEGSVFYDVTAETAAGNPDGMKVDNRGYLYCTGPGGIWIFSPDAKHLGTIQPAEIPANLAWGGADRQTLYITARTGLYRIRLNAQGL